jgi:CBS domain-containing protein
MNVEGLMTTKLETCSDDHRLDCAARIMWERDCGIVPVVDREGRIAGMLTDRDICIAGYTQNRVLSEIPIAEVIGKKPVVTVRPTDSVETAEGLMREHQLRRLAVVDSNQRLVGVLSLNDLARGAGRHPRDVSSEGVARTLAAISQPRRDGIGSQALA